MDETAVRQKLFRFLRVEMSTIPITQTDAIQCPRCGALVKPPIGRPDILVNPEYVVEMKVLRAGETSFPMDRIEERQRKWLTWWTEERGRPGYIGFGIIRQHGERQFLDHLYLIPWKAWCTAERLVEPYQSSIPWVAGKGYKKELQEGKLDLKHLFQNFELAREDGAWILPPALEGEI